MQLTKLALLSIGALTTSISAATLSTSVTQDTYIRNDGTPNSNNNGDTDNELLFGSNGGTDNLRSLLGFDVSGITDQVNSIGGGDYSNLTINSVTLTLYERRGFARTIIVNVNAYGFDFNEATSTWNNPTGDGSDTTTGGTLGTLLGSQSVTWDSTADNEQVSITLGGSSFASAIQNAETTGTLNVLLNTSTLTNPNFISFTSDRSGNTARHATLDIDYTVTAVPEPSSAALFGLSGLCLLLRRKR